MAAAPVRCRPRRACAREHGSPDCRVDGGRRPVAVGVVGVVGVVRIVRVDHDVELRLVRDAPRCGATPAARRAGVVRRLGVGRRTGARRSAISRAVFARRRRHQRSGRTPSSSSRTRCRPRTRRRRRGSAAGACACTSSPASMTSAVNSRKTGIINALRARIEPRSSATCGQPTLGRDSLGHDGRASAERSHLSCLPPRSYEPPTAAFGPDSSARKVRAYLRPVRAGSRSRAKRPTRVGASQARTGATDSLVADHVSASMSAAAATSASSTSARPAKASSSASTQRVAIAR